MVLARALSTVESGVLRIFLRQPWDEVIPERHREYILALLSDWQTVPARDIEDILEHLAGLSVGPLRAGDFGECGAEQLERIVATAFTGCPHLEVSSIELRPRRCRHERD